MLSVQVKLHKTQVAAEAPVGQGSVKVLILRENEGNVLREMQTYKKHKILHQ